MEKLKFKVVIYDTTNADDNGYLLDTFEEKREAEKFCKEENHRNLVSNSCEIAVVEPVS